MTSMDDFLYDPLGLGNKIVESIKDQKPNDVGNHAMGIRAVIQQLRNSPEGFKDRLDHLEALFQEFALGTPYELKNPLPDSSFDIIVPSGSPLGSIAVSGAFPITTPGGLSGMINSFKTQNPCGEVSVGSKLQN